MNVLNNDSRLDATLADLMNDCKVTSEDISDPELQMSRRVVSDLAFSYDLSKIWNNDDYVDQERTSYLRRYSGLIQKLADKSGCLATCIRPSVFTFEDLNHMKQLGFYCTDMGLLFNVSNADFLHGLDMNSDILKKMSSYIYNSGHKLWVNCNDLLSEGSFYKVNMKHLSDGIHRASIISYLKTLRVSIYFLGFVSKYYNLYARISFLEYFNQLGLPTFDGYQGIHEEYKERLVCTFKEVVDFYNSAKQTTKHMSIDADKSLLKDVFNKRFADKISSALRFVQLFKDQSLESIGLEVLAGNPLPFLITLNLPQILKRINQILCVVFIRWHKNQGSSPSIETSCLALQTLEFVVTSYTMQQSSTLSDLFFVTASNTEFSDRNDRYCLLNVSEGDRMPTVAGKSCFVECLAGAVNSKGKLYASMVNVLKTFVSEKAIVAGEISLTNLAKLVDYIAKNYDRDFILVDRTQNSHGYKEDVVTENIIGNSRRSLFSKTTGKIALSSTGLEFVNKLHGHVFGNRLVNELLVLNINNETLYASTAVDRSTTVHSGIEAAPAKRKNPNIRLIHDHV